MCIFKIPIDPAQGVKRSDVQRKGPTVSPERGKHPNDAVPHETHHGLMRSVVRKTLLQWFDLVSMFEYLASSIISSPLVPLKP